MSDEGDDNFLALIIGESLKVLSAAGEKKDCRHPGSPFVPVVKRVNRGDPL
nr:hypothetical protein [uncultured Actinomyces sp.]